ncbi:IniB N-terminal domain-containing protein [soil metagenome]
MANELLDFVMALVRDPEAAAQYASDPAQAIAAANLTDVTSADVNNLIPMVSDSLSMAAPAFGSESAAAAVDSAAVDSNVWASGAATAAFDAFAPLAPTDLTAQLPGVSGVIDTASAAMPDPVSALADVAPTYLDESALFNSAQSAVVDIDALDTAEPALWDQVTTDPQHLDQGHSGFDVFD